MCEQKHRSGQSTTLNTFGIPLHKRRSAGRAQGVDDVASLRWLQPLCRAEEIELQAVSIQGIKGVGALKALAINGRLPGFCEQNSAQELPME